MIRRKNYRRINALMLLRIMGWLVIIEGAFMLIPMFVSLCYGESDWCPFFYTTLLTLAIGSALAIFVKPQSMLMGKREGYLLTASVWIVFSLFGMLPFIFSAQPYTVAEAYTEAMSGLTTTGATIVNDVDPLSHGIKIWRSLMQWIGGMGIILFTLAVIPMLNHAGGIQMFNAEVTGITHGKLMPRISQTAKGLWSVYILLTICCFLLLWAGPMDAFESINHAFSTIATGGFSIYNDGIEHFHSNYVKIVTTIFMFLGSVNFALIFAMAFGNFKPLMTDEPIRVLSIVTISLTVIIMICEYMHGTVHDVVNSTVDTVFIIVSAMSSTSYVIDGVNDWGPLAVGLITMLIFMGGCAGSTSGGAKIDRIIVLVKYMHNEILHALQPNSITTVKMGDKPLQLELVQKVIAFLALYVIIIIIGAVMLTAMNVPIVDSVFSTMSCISNSGTCFDVGTLGGSLAPLPAAGKVVLSFIMLTGRLEVYTVLVLFTGQFWHK